MLCYNGAMFPLTVGLILALLIALLTGRFGFRKATSLSKLTKYALMTTLMAFFLLFIGAAFQVSSRMEREATTLTPLRTLSEALRAEEDGRYMLLQGRLSELNKPVMGSDYLAYVRSGRDGSDAEYQLPDLLIELEGGSAEIERSIYEQYSWHEESSTAFETTQFLLPNDEIIVYGRGYLGESIRDGVREARLFLRAPFVFEGNMEEFVHELVPTLQSRVRYAQYASTVSFVAATIVLLSPLPKGRQILRNH